jgi:glycerol-3-phosphate dehydrogenase
MLRQLNQAQQWDIAIIGGGATGLGAALDAASRGYKTILIEQYDFGKGTSSRSTKLVHGGVRYLAQGNVKLVMQALRERAYLLKNAPHVTTASSFVVPVYSLFDKLFYGIGLKTYDVLAGKLSIGKTRWLNKQETIEKLKGIDAHNLFGGVLYLTGNLMMRGL